MRHSAGPKRLATATITNKGVTASRDKMNRATNTGTLDGGGV